MTPFTCLPQPSRRPGPLGLLPPTRQDRTAQPWDRRSQPAGTGWDSLDFGQNPGCPVFPAVSFLLRSSLSVDPRLKGGTIGHGFCPPGPWTRPMYMRLICPNGHGWLQEIADELEA